jgi:hypothetical protein
MQQCDLEGVATAAYNFSENLIDGIRLSPVAAAARMAEGH